MSSSLNKITTDRLVLVAATRELAVAERESPCVLGRHLDADVPMGWPPPLNDESSLGWLIDYLSADSDRAGWALWYFLRKRSDGRLEAVGNGGFKGRPDIDGSVEIGYSIMEKYQRRGYAPEAVEALVRWAFSDLGVRRITAQTLANLRPSIRVLEKCGFSLVGPGEEKGVILFQRAR